MRRSPLMFWGFILVIAFMVTMQTACPSEEGETPTPDDQGTKQIECLPK